MLVGLAAFLMVFSAVPLSDLSAETPENISLGFVFESEPTHNQYNDYICKVENEAQNVVYALGLDVSLFDYDVKLSDIKYKASAYYDNYYFETDEKGVEKFIVTLEKYVMDLKITVTLKDGCAGKNLLMSSIIGDTEKVAGIIGDKFSEGDRIVIDAKLSMAYYKEYDETDMLRNDGKYLMDSWDVYSSYVLMTSGNAVFTMDGKTTETTFETIDANDFTSICNWRYTKDISEMSVGDTFDYDRNNRVLFNMHSCNYMIGNGIYNLVNTQTTSTSYMDKSNVLKEKHFFTVDQLNSPDYIYKYKFDHSKEEMSKLGTINEDYGDAVIEITSDYINCIENKNIDIYSQKDIDKLNADLNGKQTLIYVLGIVCILLIIAFIVFYMKSKKTV